MFLRSDAFRVLFNRLEFEEFVETDVLLEVFEALLDLEDKTVIVDGKDILVLVGGVLFSEFQGRFPVPFPEFYSCSAKTTHHRSWISLKACLPGFFYGILILYLISFRYLLKSSRVDAA